MLNGKVRITTEYDFAERCREYDPTPQPLCEQQVCRRSQGPRLLPDIPSIPLDIMNSTRYSSKVPERSEGRDSSFLASLHNLGVSYVIRSDEDHFGIPGVVYFLQNFHRIWPTTS